MKLRVFRLGIFLTAIVACSLLRADEAASLFHQGNQAYQAGDFSQAVTAYEKIIALGKENWQVYFNLGNAYFKLRQPGRAILNYERALRLNRNNEDVRFNLDLANLTITDRILEPPRSLVLVWLDNVINLFPVEQTAILALIFWVVACAGLILNVVARRQSWQHWGRTAAWSAGSVFLVFALLFAIALYEQQTVQHGIVLETRVVARSSPGNDATEVFILHEGTKVRLQEESSEWQRIQLADGKVGWLPAKAVGKI